MTLYRTYRPTSFDDVIGNEETIEALQSKLESKGRPHSYLMSGPAGCGKTTLGRILAHELDCKGTDYMELDSADFRGIETIRSIRRQVDFRPMEGKSRVWLLDEAHAVTNDAQDALLKVLEEPPSHVYFILCTTAPHKLKPTIRSRCSEYTVSPLSEKEMLILLRRVVKAEKGTLQKSIYLQIARDSLGHPRKALTILEQVLGLPPEKQAKIASKVALEQSQVIELCRALLQGAPWKKVSRLLNGLKDEEPEGIRRQVLGYCQSVLLKGKENDRAGLVMEAFMDPFYDTPGPQLIFACYSVCTDG